MTNLVTYVARVEDVDRAIAAGADELILEDSKLAVRSYADDFSTPGFAKYKTLADHARNMRSDIRLTVNIDKLIHDRHLPLLQQAATAIIDAGVQSVRVQDPGVALLFNELGDFTFQLATETGNNNLSGLRYYADNQLVNFERQVLSNDWELASIHQARAAVSCELEFLVHGPVLLQYTDRRLMAGYDADSADDPDQLAASPQRMADVEGRAYPLYDNPHGHFMYASFDKALYKYAEQLRSCQFDTWLIDARGESADYLICALQAYREIIDAEPREATYQSLQEQARRHLKPGFFLINNTDYVFEADAKRHAEKRCLARVVDSIKRKTLVFEVLEPFALGVYPVRTPEGKEKTLRITHMEDLQGNEIAEANTGDLVKVSWAKGLYADCELLAE